MIINPSLNQSMVENKTRKVKQLLKSLLQEGHIDDMTAKWLSLTPNPPRIPIFYTLTKIHKPTPVERPIISWCDGPTERMSAFLDRLIQSISQKRDWYVKDKTDFLNFIKSAKLPKYTFLVSGRYKPLHQLTTRRGRKHRMLRIRGFFFMQT